MKSVAASGVAAAGPGRANTEVPSAPAIAPSAPANATEAASMAKRLERDSSAISFAGDTAAGCTGGAGALAASAGFMASTTFIAASTGFGISIAFGISKILGISAGLAASLAGAAVAVLMAGVSAAGSCKERLICCSEDVDDASEAGAAAVSAASDGDLASVSVRVLMEVPSFVVDELETMGVTKTFKIFRIPLCGAGI